MSNPKRMIFGLVVIALLSLSFQSVTAQGEPVLLDLWIFEGEGEFLPPLIEAFQAANPNVTIQITDIPEGEYVTKIDTALLAGEPPDLGFIYVPRWIAAGNFLPIDDMLALMDINVDEFNVGAMSANCLRDDQVYCLGTYTGAILLFYNKDMLDAANIPYPSPTEPMTIDQYADMALTLTKQSDDIAQYVWGGDASVTNWWMDARTLFSPDGRTALGYVNDEATIHAYQVIADMRAQGSAMTAGAADMFQGVDLLSTGQLATSIVDNIIAVRQLEAAGIRWGATVPPVEQAGEEPWVSMWSDGIGVFSGSDYPQEAAAFVAFLGSEGNRLRYEVTGDLPLNMRIAEEVNWAGSSEGRQEVLAAVQTARPVLFVPDYWDVTGLLWEGFDGLMLEDGLSAAEAFAEITPLIQETLDEAWATWDQFSRFRRRAYRAVGLLSVPQHSLE